MGYGDYFPQSIPGRVITFFICIWGVFIVSMTVVTLTNYLTLSPEEKKVTSIIERLNKREEVREHAAFILTIMGKLKKLRDRKIPLFAYQLEKKRLTDKLEYHFSKFKYKSR